MDIVLAEISGSLVLTILVQIIVAAVIYFILDWMLDKLALPEPFNKLARGVVIVAVAFLIINALLAIAGHPLVKW